MTGEQFDLALRDAEFGLTNTQSQTQPEGYLRWANDSERVLGNVLGSDAIRHLIHTPRYWAIVEMQGESLHISRVVSAEIEDRLKLIRALRDEWSAARRAWSKQVINVVLAPASSWRAPTRSRCSTGLRRSALMAFASFSR